MNLLKKADFSKETQLKATLYKKLFGGETVVPFPGREQLTDEDVALVSAAAGSPPAAEKEHPWDPSGRDLSGKPY